MDGGRNSGTCQIMRPLLFWQVLLAALALDLLLGDPAWLPHPIRWMGKAIAWFEPHFRKMPLSLIFSGTLFAIFLFLMTWATAFILSSAVHRVYPLLGSCVDILLIYFSISIRSLERAAGDVLGSLRHGSLAEARNKVGFIVGRDTRYLNQGGVAGATVETVAENFVDGVVSPLFFACIGGAPLAMAFKMASTLDSMVGYKNKTYAAFGKASARLDDLLNFIPARISIPLISLTAQLLAGRGRIALMTALREGAHHASPNAGYPEAAFAGALGVKLNGPNYYHGKRVSKPFIGKAFGAVRTDHIQKACDLMLLAALLWVGILAVAALFMQLV